MRVRCSSCGAEYEAAVTRAALDRIARCDRCGRTALHAVEPGDGRHGGSTEPTLLPDGARRRRQAP